MMVDTENAEMHLAHQREKLKTLLSREDAISIANLKQTPDLNQHKIWIHKLIKRAGKLEVDLEFDFITELSVMRKRQYQLDELLQKNAEFELQI